MPSGVEQKINQGFWHRLRGALLSLFIIPVVSVSFLDFNHRLIAVNPPG